MAKIPVVILTGFLGVGKTTFLENEPPRFYKIQKTINEVNFDSVYNLIENPMPCC